MGHATAIQSMLTPAVISALFRNRPTSRTARLSGGSDGAGVCAIVGAGAGASPVGSGVVSVVASELEPWALKVFMSIVVAAISLRENL